MLTLATVGACPLVGTRPLNGRRALSAAGVEHSHRRKRILGTDVNTGVSHVTSATRSSQPRRSERRRSVLVESRGGATAAPRHALPAADEGPAFAALPASVPTRWRRAVVFIALAMLACNLDRTALAVAGAEELSRESRNICSACTTRSSSSLRSPQPQTRAHRPLFRRPPDQGRVRLHAGRHGRPTVVVPLGVFSGTAAFGNPGRQVRRALAPRRPPPARSARSPTGGC